MRISRLSFLCFAAALLVACSSPPVRTGPPSDEARDRSEMMAALQKSADAWNQADLKGHLAIYDDSVTMMTKNGPRPGVAAIEAAFGDTYFQNGVPKQALRMERAAVRMLSPDSALMTGRFVLSGGGLPEKSGWFTLLWVRTSLGWRVVHDHTS